jgi:hypothetical protein
MPSVDKLRSDYEKAEAKAFKLTAQKDEVRDRLRAATDDAAAAQKALADALAVEALAERDDIGDAERQRIAESLGLDLG